MNASIRDVIKVSTVLSCAILFFLQSILLSEDSYNCFFQVQLILRIVAVSSQYITTGGRCSFLFLLQVIIITSFVVKVIYANWISILLLMLMAVAQLFSNSSKSTIFEVVVKFPALVLFNKMCQLRFKQLFLEFKNSN